jgi:hypothetical protein
LYEVKSSAISYQLSEPEKKQSESSSSYITVGTSPAVVFSDKRSFTNVVRLWIQSDYPKKQLFPELRLTKKLRTKNQELRTTLPHFTMIDEATYQTMDAKTHSLFAEPPKYMTPWEWPQAFTAIRNNQLSSKNEIKESTNSNSSFLIDNYISILSQSSDMDMIFKATVVISPNQEPGTKNPAVAKALAGRQELTCPTCVVILKQTYHPNWKATVNGKNVTPIQVFPAFSAIKLEEPGTYTIIFSYQPSRLKQLLFFGTIVGLFLIGGIITYRQFFRRIPTR